MAAFFYGTLMNDAVLGRVLCGPAASAETKSHKLNTLRRRPAMLKGHKRFALKNLDYPAVIEADLDDEVVGILCEGLTENDIVRLDTFEGDEYARCSVKATPLAGDVKEAVDCAVYVWIGDKLHLELHDWQPEEFLKSRLNDWLQRRCEFNMVDNLEIV
ncbi:uncharacterized protein BYT42DRAFT_579120 [Radiomyces spectabilis]|uniref:uncharacterized protein n=1 Tax=Radiomyces spectabilis TaxID=64574 RepID=UPI00221E7159|nr:uncharacterized protein BYT42DRAFT_579120 [Radiomyces spectabilis]KAI8373076.1 hypothetical protein BYT42DRAFT_579120 [Radiomyces spectabilis]